MSFKQDVVDELNVLMHFSLSSMQQGIKVHSNAEENIIAATQRLFEKGIITQEDGGYLTDLGLEAEELANKLLAILGSKGEISQV
ncbi:MAG: TIGR02647 family protein [Gammaproteobacteria bacterium]|nr:TIGR02647 family protein [Gammaproteobacteria bacterium]